jgi:hypothetical protein
MLASRINVVLLQCCNFAMWPPKPSRTRTVPPSAQRAERREKATSTFSVGDVHGKHDISHGKHGISHDKTTSHMAKRHLTWQNDISQADCQHATTEEILKRQMLYMEHISRVNHIHIPTPLCWPAAQICTAGRCIRGINTAVPESCFVADQHILCLKSSPLPTSTPLFWSCSLADQHTFVWSCFVADQHTFVCELLRCRPAHFCLRAARLPTSIPLFGAALLVAWWLTTYR